MSNKRRITVKDLILTINGAKTFFSITTKRHKEKEWLEMFRKEKFYVMGRTGGKMWVMFIPHGNSSLEVHPALVNMTGEQLFNNVKYSKSILHKVGLFTTTVRELEKKILPPKVVSVPVKRTNVVKMDTMSSRAEKPKRISKYLREKLESKK